MNTTLPLLALLLAAVPASAQTGQSVTQPSANQNQPQILTNQSQQPPNVSGATTQGQQMSQPSANQNQPQTLQNQNQNSRTPGATGTTGTGPNR